MSNEFRVELLSDEETGRDRCVVIAEAATGAMGGTMAESLGKKLRVALQVTPEVEIRAPGSFERTTFKAQRFVDLRNPERQEAGEK